MDATRLVYTHCLVMCLGGGVLGVKREKSKEVGWEEEETLRRWDKKAMERGGRRGVGGWERGATRWGHGARVGCVRRHPGTVVASGCRSDAAYDRSVHPDARQPASSASCAPSASEATPSPSRALAIQGRGGPLLTSQCRHAASRITNDATLYRTWLNPAPTATRQPVPRDMARLMTWNIPRGFTEQVGVITRQAGTR